MISANINDFIGGEYGTIYADPPWQYGNQKTRGSTDNHYVTMPFSEIQKLPVSEIAAQDAHLHLWTTTGFIQEGLQLIKDWGFEYRSQLIWVKPQMGMGNYWRVSHEILLLGIRGNAKRFNEKNHKSWIELSRLKHSQKPNEIRSLIERVSNGPRLEMFARECHEGWDCFGNELNEGNMDKQLKLEKWADPLVQKRVKNKGFKIERITPIGEPDYSGNGDYNIETPDAGYTMELKCEEKSSKNLFLESWSHKKINKKGWMETCKADVLFYIFQETGSLFKVKLPELQEFYQSNKHKYPEVPQQKTVQKNDTWGFLFPIQDLKNNLKSFKEENIYE